MEIWIGIMLNEERCLLNYKISFEWILYPLSRSVPLIAAHELNYSSTMLSNPPTSASVVHSSLLLHVEPRVCWSPFSIIIWARRRPGIPQRTYRHSNHSSSLFVGRLLLYSELLYSPQGPLFLLNSFSYFNFFLSLLFFGYYESHHRYHNQRWRAIIHPGIMLRVTEIWTGRTVRPFSFSSPCGTRGQCGWTLLNFKLSGRRHPKAPPEGWQAHGWSSDNEWWG